MARLLQVFALGETETKISLAGVHGYMPKWPVEKLARCEGIGSVRFLPFVTIPGTNCRHLAANTCPAAALAVAW